MMKQRLLNLGVAILVAASASSATPRLKSDVPEVGPTLPSFTLGSAVKLADKAPSGAQEVTVPIEFDLGFPREELVLEGAVAYADGSYEEAYSSRIDFTDDDEIRFVFRDLPVGNYNFLVVVDYPSQTGVNQLILFKKNVEVVDGTVLKVERTSDCRDYAIEHVASDNTLLTLPLDEDSGSATASAAEFFTLLKDNTAGSIFMAHRSASYGCRNNIVTNVDPAKFSLYCADVLAGDTGVYTMSFPIDMSGSKTSTSTGTWESATVGFQPTPFNKKFDEVMVPQGYRQYDYLYLLVVADNEMITDGFDGFTQSFNKNNHHAYSGYEGEPVFEIMTHPVDCNVQGAHTAITGKPLRVSGEGLRQVGLQFDFREFLFARPYYFMEWGNPSYAIDVDGIIYGNCAPSLIYVAWAYGLEYTYLGRYGEHMGIDNFRFPDRWTEEQREALGKQTNEVNVTIDGQLFATTLDEFDSKKFPPGKISASITTDNVLVDGEIPGFNVTQLDYTLENGKSPELPNLTGLQFRNISSEVTDRFGYSDQGVLQFTAGTYMCANVTTTQDMMYYTPLVGLEVEYAPYDSDEFMPLDIELADDLSYERGYGQGYCVSLATVDRPSANKWYDLRLVLDGPNQSKMVQTISPAFRIDSPTSIAAVVGDCEAVRVVGNDIIVPEGSKVYGVNGVEYRPTGLTPGVYIVKYGNESVKAVVR